MEVVNKLINTEEALVNQFDHDGKQDADTSGAAGDSSSKFRKRPSVILTVDGCRPSTFNIEDPTWCWTAPAHSMKGARTQSVSANSSRGRFARPTTQSDPEAMGPVIFTALQ
jgi:hypothetical protein